MHHCNPTLPSIAPSNVPVIHGPPAHPVSSSPAFLTLCAVSSSPSPPPKITFLVVAGVCLSIETFGRPVHLSVLAWAFFFLSFFRHVLADPIAGFCTGSQPKQKHLGTRDYCGARLPGRGFERGSLALWLSKSFFLSRISLFR